MKIPNPPPNQRGSFGMPKEDVEYIQNLQNKKDNPIPEKESQPKTDKSEDWPLDNKEEKPTEEEVNKAIGEVDPYAVLKEMGIEPTADDFHSLIFRGFVEKTVIVAHNPFNNQELKATFRTLTAEDFDLIDELVANDLESIKMTNSGVDIRRSMWGLAFSMLELNGRPLCKHVTSEGKFDPTETAKQRRKVISKLNPFILNRITELHARMSSAFTILVTSSEYKAVKK